MSFKWGDLVARPAWTWCKPSLIKTSPPSPIVVMVWRAWQVCHLRMTQTHEYLLFLLNQSDDRFLLIHSVTLDRFRKLHLRWWGTNRRRLAECLLLLMIIKCYVILLHHHDFLQLQSQKSYSYTNWKALFHWSKFKLCRVIRRWPPSDSRQTFTTIGEGGYQTGRSPYARGCPLWLSLFTDRHVTAK